VTASGTSHWSTVADHWDAIGPPLRPAPDDVAEIVAQAAALPPSRRRVLVLGATRELGEVAWPEGTALLAVDRSPSMLQRLWPGPPGTSVLGEWRALPLAAASVDLAVCDGGWHLLDRPDGQERLAAELARVVAPGGRLAVRLFEPSPSDRTLDEVLDLLDADGVVDANHLKVLLWMAVRDPGRRVAVARVWDALDAACPDLDELADRCGWPRATVRAFEAYRGSPDRYDLLAGDELDRQLVAAGPFRRVREHPGAALAPDLRFPTFVYERRP
jgi:SAM-dependent methyltransferase